MLCCNEVFTVGDDADDGVEKFAQLDEIVELGEIGDAVPCSRDPSIPFASLVVIVVVAAVDVALVIVDVPPPEFFISISLNDSETLALSIRSDLCP